MHIFLNNYTYLSIASVIAGIVDTLAGGGGLITLPALLIAGVSPTLALGTNKLQACVGELNATVHFVRHGRISIKELSPGLLFAILGAGSGAVVVQYIHADVQNKFIPFLLLIVLLYSVLAGKFIKEEPQQRLTFIIFWVVFGLLIGFYNGFFGPGTGSFWVVALMFFLGFDLKKATLYGKPLNFVGNFISVLCFIMAGLINYKIAAIMAVGQLIGSQIGAKLVIYKEAKIIRPVFIVVVAVMTVSLFVKNYY